MQQNHRKWSSDFATAFFTTFSPCCPKWFNHMQFFKALSTWVQKDHLITMVVFWPTWLVFLAYDWTFLDQRSFRSGFYVLLEFMIWLRFQHQAGICFHRLRARHPNLVEPHKRARRMNFIQNLAFFWWSLISFSNYLLYHITKFNNITYQLSQQLYCGLSPIRGMFILVERLVPFKAVLS